MSHEVKFAVSTTKLCPSQLGIPMTRMRRYSVLHNKATVTFAGLDRCFVVMMSRTLVHVFGVVSACHVSSQLRMSLRKSSQCQCMLRKDSIKLVFRSTTLRGSDLLVASDHDIEAMQYVLRCSFILYVSSVVSAPSATYTIVHISVLHYVSYCAGC
jgi:hypothetical protein